jgi:peptidyl-prolyl cis-trans isomerase SurA
MKSRIALIAIFVLVLAAASRGAVLLDRVVAVVNQEVITWSDLYKDMESEASPQVREMKPAERLEVFRKNESSFLDTLINFKLQVQEAKKLGISVSDDEVKEAVDNIKKKYAMTDSVFTESLKKEGFTREEYMNRLRDQILVGKVVNQQIRSKILITDAEVKRYLGKNRALAADAEDEYRISQIFFSRQKNDEGKTGAEEKAAEVMKKLREGESFAELAKTYSEDPSASVGGDLGFIKKGQLMKEFGEVVAKLKQGEVSQPFWSERGLHIIKLEGIRSGKTEREIMEEARKKLGENIFEQRYTSWIKSLREQAFVEIRL